MRRLLVAAALGLVASPIDAQRPAASSSQRVTVIGTISDARSGSRLAGAAVDMVGREGVVFTDLQGMFQFDDVASGTIMVRVRQLGFRDYAGEHVVGMGSDTLRIALEADPVVLEGIQVLGDRFESRRRAAPFSVRAHDEEALLASPAYDVFGFLRERMKFTSCPTQPFGTRFPTSARGPVCIFHRGSWVVPRVFVDDAPWIGGIENLGGWDKRDLYRVEIVRGGTEIHLFTKQFAGWLARGNARLQPYIIAR